MFAFLIAAAASSMTPTLELQPRSIEHNGIKATYTRSVEADGTVHLRGVYEGPSRAPFHFVVRGDTVRGQVDGARTSFKRPRAR